MARTLLHPPGEWHGRALEAPASRPASCSCWAGASSEQQLPQHKPPMLRRLVPEPWDSAKGDIYLSFLPLAHIYGRWAWPLCSVAQAPKEAEQSPLCLPSSLGGTTRKLRGRSRKPWTWRALRQEPETQKAEAELGIGRLNQVPQWYDSTMVPDAQYHQYHGIRYIVPWYRAHVPRRCVEECYLHGGAAIAYWSGDAKRLSADIRACRPTIFCSVPRVYERFESTIVEKVTRCGMLWHAVARCDDAPHDGAPCSHVIWLVWLHASLYAEIILCVSSA